MDEIDIGICMMLVQNSRIPYRDLAELFNMSVNSIHKRIKSMVDLGIIDKFVSNLSYNAFNPLPFNVVMFGRSLTKNPKAMLKKLGNHENIYNVAYHSGNLFFIHAHLRNSNELEPLVSWIRQRGEISELKVGLDSTPPPFELKEPEEIPLSKLDFLIINALKDNSRNTVADVADEVRASTKTIRRHLNRLVEKNRVNFSIHWYPDKSSEFISMIILQLKPKVNIDKMKLLKEIGENPKTLFSWSFSTLPNTIIVCAWASSMKELQELEASFKSENYESVSVNVGIEGGIFPTWRDTYLENKIKEIKENSV